jgi:hypothetical protein
MQEWGSTSLGGGTPADPSLLQTRSGLAGGLCTAPKCPPASALPLHVSVPAQLPLRAQGEASARPPII